MKKIKNILFTIGIGIIALPKKVFGVQTTTIENFGNQTDYGVEILNAKSMIIVIIVEAIKFIFVPLVLLIGLIIYWKRSKNSTKIKIIKSVIAVLLGVGLIGLITYVLNSVN